MGLYAKTIAMMITPTAGAARRNPKPVAPTKSTSFAKAGKRATAPPNKTANKSVVLRITVVSKKTKWSPSVIFLSWRGQGL